MHLKGTAEGPTTMPLIMNDKRMKHTRYVTATDITNLHGLFHTLGIPVSGGLGLGFLAGFVRTSLRRGDFSRLAAITEGHQCQRAAIHRTKGASAVSRWRFDHFELFNRRIQRSRRNECLRCDQGCCTIVCAFVDRGIERPQDPRQRSQSWSDSHTGPFWLAGGTGRAVQEECRKQQYSYSCLQMTRINYPEHMSQP